MWTKRRFVGLMVLLSLVPLEAAAQSRPYTLEEVLELTQSGVPSARILELVDDKCLAFPVDAAAETRLRGAGANDELIVGLRSVCPGPRGAEPAPSESRASASAGGAAIRSLIVPGLGQFYLKRPAMGVLFLGAAGGAVAMGVLSESVTVVCAAKTTGECPPGEVISEDSEPRMGVGLAAFAAVAATAALEAFVAARRAAASPATAFAHPGSPAPRPVLLGPSVTALQSGEVRVSFVRLTF